MSGRDIQENALAAARLRGAHRYRAVLIDLNHVPSEAAAAMDSPPEGLSGLGDDRVGVGTSLNREALGNFPLQEGVERVFSSPERIDFSVHRHVGFLPTHWSGDAADANALGRHPR